jgi:hypothetical protein
MRLAERYNVSMLERTGGKLHTWVRLKDCETDYSGERSYVLDR